MRAANQAIERERHPVPTVEDLIVDLNGATVFSKIDLNQGYHQLELDEESRSITTFATHIGLFRYKRLSFGINSAAEIFQKSIEDVLQGIEGVRNISDDIIVFGKSQADHDISLRTVLQRMRENNLNVNPEKCLFNQSSIDFFGHHFSSDGFSADDKKISSLINASPPKNATEARAFLAWPSTLHVSSRTLHPSRLQSVNSPIKMPNGCGDQNSNMRLNASKLVWQLQRS